MPTEYTEQDIDEKVKRLIHIAEGEIRGYVPKGTLQLAIDDEFRDTEQSAE